MSEQASPLIQSEYIAGAFFGLVTLDLFMFFTHCLLSGSTSDYNLSTIVITLPILMVIYFQRLHSKQDH
mgnify:FL=1